MRLIGVFGRDTNASVSILFATAFVALICCAAVAVDYANLERNKVMMQSAADSAALAAAKEMTLVGAAPDVLTTVAQQYAAVRLESRIQDDQITVAIDSEAYSVTVAINQTVPLYFGEALGLVESAVAVTATATVLDNHTLCVLGLDRSEPETIYLDSNARMSAPGCSVFSNSSDPRGISVQSNALLEAEFICSGGGKSGSGRNYRPSPELDCPMLDDPLAGRNPPSVSGCDYRNMFIKDVRRVIKPGVYCGGLTLDGNARIGMEPGIYVFKDGPFVVDSNTIVKGKYVGLYFVGNDAVFRFASNANIDLGAPKDGPMAGLLIFEDRGNKVSNVHEIFSNYARNLLGTIYLPRGKLFVDADNDIADRSAYTAIIARQIELNSGPVLHLNTDYGATDVPVPSGVGPLGGDVRLSR